MYIYTSPTSFSKTLIKRLHRQGVEASPLQLYPITCVCHLKPSNSPLPSTPPPLLSQVNTVTSPSTVTVIQWPSSPQPCPTHCPNPSHLSCCRADLIKSASCLKPLEGSKASKTRASPVALGWQGDVGGKGGRDSKYVT